MNIDGSIVRELGFGFGMDKGAAGKVFTFGTGRALAITALYLKAYTLSGLSTRPDHLQYSSLFDKRHSIQLSSVCRVAANLTSSAARSIHRPPAS